MKGLAYMDLPNRAEKSDRSKALEAEGRSLGEAVLKSLKEGVRKNEAELEQIRHAAPTDKFS